MKANLCLLVIGDLGEAGKLSLSTLIAISPTRVCVAANTKGKEWLLGATPDSTRGVFCFHDSITQNFEYSFLEAKEDYSEYRTQDFRILTLLKWDLLDASLRSHPDSDTILFSDLDIYWMQDPDEYVSRLKSSNSTMFVQNDASDTRPLWCCTGVMFWKNNQTSINLLAQLRERHKSQIASGFLQDDEDTFNQLISDDSCSLDYERLPSSQFLVGRNFTHLFFKGSKKETQYCFHANYLTGLNRKFDSLNSIDRFKRTGTFPWKELMKFLMLPTLRRVLNGMRRRFKLS
jgi:hypothetical protein